MDTITILKSDKPAAKRVSLDENQHPRVEAIARSYHHDVESEDVNGIYDIHQTVAKLTQDPNRLVIRGRLTDGHPSCRIRRTSRPQGDEPANFEAADRRWIMIDIDDLPIPNGLEDVNCRTTDLVKYAITHLPQEFHQTACVYHWSGSMGFKKGKIRLHLWFWLDRPVSDRQAKNWLGNCPVDKSVYTPVQPHFTANPILDDGIEDPINQRLGLYMPVGAATEVVTPAEFPILGNYSGSSGCDFVQLGNGDQTIVRHSETGLVIDGRERFLFLTSINVMSNFVQSKEFEADDCLEQLAKQIWDVFCSEADVSDGKWTFWHAHREAQRRLDQFNSSTCNLTSKSEVTLHPVDKPFIEITSVQPAAAQERLENCLTSFFEKVDQAPKQVVRITTGAGKTHATLQHLQSFMASNAGKTVEIYVPRHDLAEEYLTKIHELGRIRAKVIHVRPRTGGAKMEHPVLCKRVDYVRSLEDAGIGVFHNACRNNVGERCIHFDQCQYIEQFKETDVDSETLGNTVRIFVHQYLGLPRNPLLTDPDLVIIDEAFIQELLDTETKLSPSEIKQYFKTPHHPNLGRVIVDALEEADPLLKALRKEGIGPEEIGQVSLDQLRSGLEFDNLADQPISVTGNLRVYRRLNELTEVLIQELQLQPHRDHVERIVYDNRVDKVCVVRSKPISIPESSAVLCLDATADEMLIEKVLGPVNFERIDVSQKAFVTQVYDRTGSKAFWHDNQKKFGNLVSVVNAWAEFGELPLIVGHKDLADRFRNAPDLDPRVKVSHFAALRGSNDAEKCSVVFVTGRNMPPPSAVDLKARALFWDDDLPLQHDDAALTINSEIGDNKPLLPLMLKGFVQSDKNSEPQSGVKVPTF
jgi:hypothetical protein